MPDYVKGGGGNTSAKTADTLWVKPSGTTLAGLSPEGFVAMDRAKLAGLYELDVPPDPHAREALVKQTIAAAVEDGQGIRPSVESPLHDALEARFVVHTHPALVNGMTCARQGREACAKLFPDALWVPYTSPGYMLCMAVRERVREYVVRHRSVPKLLFLRNHGIFVAADTADEIRSVYHRVMDTLRREYGDMGVSTELRVDGAVTADAIEATWQSLRGLLGEDATGIAYGGIFEVASGPVCPDHILYAGSFPYVGPLTREGLDAFRGCHGSTAVVFATEVGVFAATATQRRAGLALELVMEGALVCQLSQAFGGIQYLTDAERKFVEHWEAGAYRQRQLC
jgi:rhamnose utilization protein RhaD (predicted bifunctional aldolase and dehydrogenase)